MTLKTSSVTGALRTRPHPARLRLFTEGYSVIDFARFHGCSPDWAYRVLRREVPAPKRFRRDLAHLLSVPEEQLFPEYTDRDVER